MGDFAINLVASPGTGETTLLCRTIQAPGAALPVVVWGNWQTFADADRIRAAWARAIKINTGKGCHLDARMVCHAIDELLAGPVRRECRPSGLPRRLGSGKNAKVAIPLVSKGEVKPLKYLDRFTAVRRAVLTKTDLDAHCDAGLDAHDAHLRRIDPAIAGLRLSARTGAGTSSDSGEMAAGGVFLSDLYPALSVADIAVQPLRGRGDAAINAHYLRIELAARQGRRVLGIDAVALVFLSGWGRPGNPCELSNAVTRKMVRGSVPEADLICRPILQAAPGETGADRSGEAVLALAGSLMDRVGLVEMRILRETMAHDRRNKSRAAAELGPGRVGLRAGLDPYRIP